MEKRNKKLKIKNEIVSLALFGYRNDVCKNINISMGGWIDSKNILAKKLLTHCVKRALNIYRLPGHEERYDSTNIYNDYSQKIKELFSKFTKEELAKAYEEIKRIYNYTQMSLKRDNKNKNKTIKLRRFLSVFELSQVMDQILKNKPFIEYRTNIITSYSTDNNSYGYNSPIYLEREVKFEDILLHNEYVQYAEHSCDYIDPEREVWVLNKNIFGEVEYSLKKFKYDEKNLYNIVKNNYKDNRYFSEEDNYINYKIERPCENKIIKIFINLEQKWKHIK